MEQQRMLESEKADDGDTRVEANLTQGSGNAKDRVNANLLTSTRSGLVKAKVPVGTHYFSQKYLCGFATQAEVINYVRTQALDEEVTRLPEILRKWEEQQATVVNLVSREVRIAETI